MFDAGRRRPKRDPRVLVFARSRPGAQSRGPRRAAGWTVLLLAAACAACSGERPTDLGVRQGRLAPCPHTPNCVSSFATDPDHFIEPLLFSAPAPDVMRRVKRALGQMPRVQVVREEPHYIYAEFTSRIFRFVDDVECYLNTQTGTLHFRSASRIGHSDLGVNRDRIETLKRLLEQTDKSRSKT